MASIRRNDTLHRRHGWHRCCNYKSRPSKLEADGSKLNARKFKIVKRIFLASSFDRWRKLRSSLKLTDSSLAWHLMEAHENGECITCRATVEEEHEKSQDFGLLQESVVSCVRKFFEFEDYINLIGCLSLDFKSGRKLKVKFQQVIQPNTDFESQSSQGTRCFSHTADMLRKATTCSPEQPFCSKIADVLTQWSESSPNGPGDAPMSQELNDEGFGTDKATGGEGKGFNLSSCSVESGLSVEIDVVGTDSSQEIIPEESHGNDSLTFPNYANEEPESEEQAPENKISSLSTHNLEEVLNHRSNQTEVVKKQKQSEGKMSGNISDWDKKEQVSGSKIQPSQCGGGYLPVSTQQSSCADEQDGRKGGYDSVTGHLVVDRPLDMSIFKPAGDGNDLPQKKSSLDREKISMDEAGRSLNVVSKRKASSEADDIKTKHVKGICSPSPKKLQKHFEDTVDSFEGTDQRKTASVGKEVSLDSYNNNDKSLEHKIDYEITSLPEQPAHHGSEGQDWYGNASHSVSQDTNVDVSRNHSKDGRQKGNTHQNTKQASTPPPLLGDHAIHLHKHPNRAATPCHNTTSSSAMTNYHQNRSVTNSPANHSSSSSSIPWQRRDMSRKEEYEFLELNPFCDLAEFSARHPHVHQRTYYRWKRRIKEEFMVLEQCPDMSFAQFSGVVLQAKENVFSLWKSLIAQGKGFFALSDSSKRLESKLSSSQVTSSQEQHQLHSAESLFLQKNLSATFLDFSQHFPRASLNVFNTLKQKSMQEFALLHQNKHMSFNDFSKLVNISEEVFKEWQTNVQSLPHFQGSGSNNISSSLQSLAHVKAPDTNGFHNKNLQLSIANAMKHQLTSEHSLVPGMSESVSHNLSASYLASLQNLMFSWPGYYGLSPPLAPQHLLPFMLWPGMSGMMGSLAGAPAAAGPLAILSQLQAASSASSPASLASVLRHSPRPAEIKPDACGQDRLFAGENEGNCESQHPNSNKKLLCPDTALSPLHSHHQSDKGETGDSSLPGVLSRSRKQNLQEYIHFLHRPGLGFRDLVTLFPSISSRTFYRWRKEMNAAVLLVGENPDMEFVHFQAVFPDIPEEIFQLWQGRAKRGETLLQPDAPVSSSQDFVSKPEFKPSCQPVNPQKHAISPSVDMESKCVDLKQDITSSVSTMRHCSIDGPISHSHIKSSPALNTTLDDHCNSHLGEDLTVQKKCHKEDYLFVQRNPELDFASFSSQFPNTSVRTFYRWKKELKDAVEFLRCNPTVDYAAYKRMDATVSEEVFDIWKAIVQNDFVFEEDTNLDIASQVRVGSTSLTDENYNTALSYLHLNPSINYSQFTTLFPGVGEKTFELWKKETHQLISYIHNNPSVQFSDISNLLPHISHSSFIKWKEISASGMSSEVSSNNLLKHEVSLIDIDDSVEYTKSQMTKAFVFLMYNPTISFKSYKAKFEFVSPSTFELWLTKIRTVVVDILSNPSMDYKDFNIKDMSPELFDKLRGLQPQDLATIEESCQEIRAQCDATVTHYQTQGQHSIELSQKAFEYLQTHSSISWEDFHTMHPIVSFEVFQNWTDSLSRQISCLKEKPDLTYSQFTKLFPHTSQKGFHCLRQDSCSPSLQNPTHHFLGKYQANIDQEQLSEKVEVAARSPLDQKLCPQNALEFESGVSRETENFLHMESSLSKLAKFAHSSGLLSPHGNRQSSKPVELITQQRKLSEQCTDHRHGCDQVTHESEHVPKQVHRSSASPFVNTSHTQESKMHDATGEGHSSSSSLSALESLTADTTYNKTIHAPSTPSSIPGKEVAPLRSGLASSSTASPWQNHPRQVVLEETGVNREDDEAFSSQRQKKMSRAEYMFVKANPEVDSQEFSRIFPGVSARTFYRWKKEIRAQLQPS